MIHYDREVFMASTVRKQREVDAGQCWWVLVGAAGYWWVLVAAGGYW